MRVALLVVLTVVASACALPGGVARLAQTHHVPQGRALTRLGSVDAQTKKLCGIFLINWGAPDADMMEQTVEAALDQREGAKLIVDAQTDASIYMVPLLFSRCRVRITGTAATHDAPTAH